jgi:RNA recognition motif-containing protein
MVESLEEAGKRLRVNADGTLRSKGFGFVEFGSHVHALAALRVLNNNPAYAMHAYGGTAVRLRTCVPSS